MLDLPSRLLGLAAAKEGAAPPPITVTLAEYSAAVRELDGHREPVVFVHPVRLGLLAPDVHMALVLGRWLLGMAGINHPRVEQVHEAHLDWADLYSEAYDPICGVNSVERSLATTAKTDAHHRLPEAFQLFMTELTADRPVPFFVLPVLECASNPKVLEGERLAFRLVSHPRLVILVEGRS